MVVEKERPLEVAIQFHLGVSLKFALVRKKRVTN
jgi:hypothetical protein